MQDGESASHVTCVDLEEQNATAENQPVHSVKATISNALTPMQVPQLFRGSLPSSSHQMGTYQAGDTRRHDAEILAIRERLDHLCGLVSIRLVGQQTRIYQDQEPAGSLPALPPLGEYPLDESIISRHWRKEFPFMTIQTPSMMCLLELDPKLSAQLVARERTDVSMLSPPSDSLGFGFQYEDSMRSVNA